VRSFLGEEAALAMVRRPVKQDGSNSVASWCLVRTDLSEKAIGGAELVDRTLRLAA